MAAAKEMQSRVTTHLAEVDAATVAVQDAKTYRLQLESIVGQMMADETKARKNYDDLADKLRQLQKAQRRSSSHGVARHH